MFECRYSVKQVCFLSVFLGVFLPSAQAADVVISQIYGGNGSTYNRDYVELFNKSANAVNITGWSIQYSSATGTGLFSANGVTALNGTLQPGQYYLVGLASTTTGSALPATDAAATATNLSGTNGKVVLVNTNSGLACNGGSAACNATQTAQIVDLVGYGTANFSETAAAPAASSTTALLRSGNGCTDTDNNSADFTAGTPSPRNSASTLNACGTSTTNAAIVPSCGSLTLTSGVAGSLAISASDKDSVVNAAAITSASVSGITLSDFVSADTEGEAATANLTVANSVATGSYVVQVRFENNEAQTAVCSVNVSVQATASTTKIYSIQGSGTASTLNGQQVTTEGVVSAVFAGLNGFYLQDESGDSNQDTSDGIFVYMGSGVTPTVNVGEKIRLQASVTEFNTVTELISPSNIQVLSTGNLIAATDISLPETTEGNLEAFEGMLVRIISPMTVSQNYFQGRYGQVTLSAEGRMYIPTNVFRPNSTDAVSLKDENARRRIVLDDGRSSQNPNPIPFIGLDNTLRAGDVAETITGVIDHGLITASSTGPRDYKIHPTVTPVFSRENARTTAPQVVGGNIKVASFNVLNYFTTFQDGGTASGQTGQGCSLGASVAASNCRGANNAAEFTRQRDKIINAIAAMNADVVGLMEMQNNGVTAIQNLVDGLNAKVGAGTYARINDPATGTGDDAIKVAMIYKPAKISPSGASLSDTASINNRPTLAQAFVAANGEKFSVVVNHFKSKSCSDASGTNTDQGDGQGCYNARRVQQAAQLNSFIQTVKANAADQDVLIIGDLNAYAKEDPINDLNTAGYADQVTRFHGQSGYSYTFDGESGYLDHALANAAMASQIVGITEWHINTDEPFVIDYNTEFKQPACATCSQDLYTNAPYRSSDHDPVVVGLRLVKTISGTTARDTMTGTAGDDVITGGIGADVLTGGAGADTFVYTSMRDAIDTINDFTPQVDIIDLSNLLASIGVSTGNPFSNGYLRLTLVNGVLNLQVDVDGQGGVAPYRSLAVLKNVSLSSVDVVRDFKW